MTELRTRCAGISFLLALAVCGTAQATSCGETVRVENHTHHPVTVLIKSFYGSGFERPDPDDFAPESTWRPGTLPFIRLYEVPLGPGAMDNVFVRTLCPTPDRRHWINWSYSVDGTAPVSGQADLVKANANIIVEPVDQETSGSR